MTMCNVTVMVNDEMMSGDCEEVAAAFGVDLDEVLEIIDDMDEDEDDECEIEEEEGDCNEVLSQFINSTECSYYAKEECDMIVECQVAVVLDDEEYQGDCWEIAEQLGVDLDEIMQMIDDSDDDQEEDEECTAQYMEADCTEEFSALVEGGEYCFYSMEYDSCTGLEIMCDVTVTVNNETLSGDCDELQAYFNITDEDFEDNSDANNTDSETGDVCYYEDSGSCLEDALTQIEGVTACDYAISSDVCTGEYTCTTTVVVNGVEYSGDCTEI